MGNEGVVRKLFKSYSLILSSCLVHINSKEFENSSNKITNNKLPLQYFFFKLDKKLIA